jgi:hypothetical protein
MLSAVKEGLQSYCGKVYTCNNTNQTSILQNSKALLDHFNSCPFSKISCIQILVVSRPYTVIRYEKLKNTVKRHIARKRCKSIVLGHELNFFVKHETRGERGLQKIGNHRSVCGSSLSIKTLIYIFLEFGGHKQVIGIP